MSTTIRLTDVVLPGDHPNINSFLAKLPGVGLLDYFDASSGLTLSGTDVVAWQSFGGSVATPGTPPTFISSLTETGLPGIKYSGTEVLNCDFPVETGDGYVVIAFRFDEDANTQGMMGQHVDAENKFVLGPIDRVDMEGGMFRCRYAVGDMPSSVYSARIFSPGDVAVLGVHVHDQIADLRIDGMVDRSSTFSGTFGESGDVFHLGGISALPPTMFQHTLAACAFYSGSLSPSQLLDVDRAMGQFIGQSL